MGSVVVIVAISWLLAGVGVVALWNLAKWMMRRRPSDPGRRRRSPRP